MKIKLEKKQNLIQKINKVLKNIIKNTFTFIIDYLEEILFILAIIALVTAGFMINTIVGLIVLSIGLGIASIMVKRQKQIIANIDNKK